MNNQNQSAISAKKIIFIILALIIAIAADGYFIKVNANYNSMYLTPYFMGKSVKIYSAAPIMYFVKSFLLYGSLVFIGYSAGSIIEFIISCGIFTVLGPIVSIIKEIVKYKSYTFKGFLVDLIYVSILILIALIPFILRRVIKNREKVMETVLHIIITFIAILVLMSIYRMVYPLIFGNSFTEKTTYRLLGLWLKNTIQLLPIVLGILAGFMALSRVLFKVNFGVPSAGAGTVKYNTPVYQNGAINTTVCYNNAYTNSTVSPVTQGGNNEKVVCTSCKSELAPGSKFCIKCGAPAEVIKPQPEPILNPNEKQCINCGKAMPKHALFCTNCGAAAPAEAKEAPASVEKENLCSSCGKPINKDSKFCCYCGAAALKDKTEEKVTEVLEVKTEKVCVNCGKAIEADSKFCKHCGAYNF